MTAVRASTPVLPAKTPGGGLGRAARFVVDKLAALFSTIGTALGGIFFLPDPSIGLLLWLAFAVNPSYAVFALWGLAIGAAVKRLLAIKATPLLGGGLKANALLAAGVTAWMTQGLDMALGPRLAIAGAAAGTAAFLAATLMRAFSKSIFPPLLWAYCLVAAMMFSLCPTCTVISAKGMEPWLQPGDALGWVETFLRSLGSLLYLPDARVGVVVCLAILSWSRSLFLSGLAGWMAGAGVALALQSMQMVYFWLPVSYNYFVAGMALGAAMFLPGRLSLLVAAAAGCATSFFALVLQAALNGSAASYLPIPAAFAIWVGLGALTFAQEGALVSRNTLPDIPPEQAWWRMAFLKDRFGPDVPLFAVPVAGDIEISQGFDGHLSHKGAFRYALDFQRPAASGSIWGAIVTAPASGSVVRIRDCVPDNLLGECNYAENWGNYVVIALDAGGWALLAHLQHRTIAVAPGCRVETGAYIARVGNSGRSPVPHLHMHLQESPEPGSATLPFKLANFLSSRAGRPFLSWTATAVPARGDIVMAALANPAVYQLLAGMLPGRAVWAVASKGRIPWAFRPGRSARTLAVDVVLDEHGQHVFRTRSDGGLVSRLEPDGWRIVEISHETSPLLRLLALSVPSIPFAATAGMTWSDLAPALSPHGMFGPLVLTLAPYIKRHFRRTFCECMPAPVQAGSAFRIDSHFQPRASSLPAKVSCEFAMLRGPVRVQADFKGGSLVYSLLSFEPGIQREGTAR